MKYRNWNSYTGFKPPIFINQNPYDFQTFHAVSFAQVFQSSSSRIEDQERFHSEWTSVIDPGMWPCLHAKTYLIYLTPVRHCPTINLINDFGGRQQASTPPAMQPRCRSHKKYFEKMEQPEQLGRAARKVKEPKDTKEPKNAKDKKDKQEKKEKKEKDKGSKRTAEPSEGDKNAAKRSGKSKKTE